MDTDKAWMVLNPDFKTVTQADYDAFKLTNPIKEGTDDHIKASNLEDVTLDGITFDPLPYPIENRFDQVRGKRVTLRNCKLPYAVYGAITLKGSISDWLLESCEIANGGKYGVEVGQFDNYWFPGRAPTRRGKIINCTGPAPIVVELWNAEKPEIINSNVVLKVVPIWKWLPYFLFRYAVVRIQGVKTK